MLEVIAENPEEEHVPEDVRNTAMHEHRCDQGEIDSKPSLLQAWNHQLLAGCRMLNHAVACLDISTGDNLLRHGRICVGEAIVCPELLEKHEHQNINGDQNVINNRRRGSISVVISYRKNHSLLQGSA